MEIILEYVIFDNFCVDSLLMWGVVKALNQPIFKSGIICVGVVGAGFACVSPLINLSGLGAVLLKLSMAFLLCVISNFTFKRAFSRFILYVLFTFCFGGALIGIFTFLNVSTSDGIGLNYSANLPIGAILSCAIMFVLLIITLIKKIVLQHKNKVVDISLIILNKSQTVRGFVDTGNLLHSKSGLPVVVVEEKLLSKWLSNDERMALFLGNFNQLSLNNIGKISVSSLGKTYNMVTFDALAKIGEKLKKIAIGITYQKIKNFDVVIGSELLEV